MRISVRITTVVPNVEFSDEIFVLLLSEIERDGAAPPAKPKDNCIIL
jgi:hypothetical protein